MSVPFGRALPKQIVVWDTETDGTDVESCHIVTSFIGLMDTATGEVVDRWSWLLNTGHEIPTGASDVHGITTEIMRAKGTDAKAGIFEIMQRLDILTKHGAPLVIMNAPFDTSILDREQARHWPGTRRVFEGQWMHPNGSGGWQYDLEYNADAMYRTMRPVIFDPMPLDRAFDQWRKGTRKLVDLAKVYGVPVEENAHDAEADCRMAGRVAIELMKYWKLQGLTPEQVHAKTIITKADQARDLAAYWQDKKIPKLRAEAQKGVGPERYLEIQTEIADKLEAIEHVRSTGHFWPLVPRPEERIIHD